MRLSADIQWFFIYKPMMFSLTGRYMAPEVLRNEEYDTKVDVFSFGLILQVVRVEYNSQAFFIFIL